MPLAPRQWTILRIMAVIAALAPLLALARSPFYFWLVVSAGSIALFWADGIRRRRYGRLAWFLCIYPALPLLSLYLHWWLARRGVLRRYSPGFDGVLGISDIVGYLCLMAYVACITIAVGGAAARVRENPALGRAARWVVFAMPPVWAALFGFTLWDPFGMLGYFFR